MLAFGHSAAKCGIGENACLRGPIKGRAMMCTPSPAPTTSRPPLLFTTPLLFKPGTPIHEVNTRSYILQWYSSSRVFSVSMHATRHLRQLVDDSHDLILRIRKMTSLCVKSRAHVIPLDNDVLLKNFTHTDTQGAALQWSLYHGGISFEVPTTQSRSAIHILPLYSWLR
jgi:hypothetical protein